MGRSLNIKQKRHFEMVWTILNINELNQDFAPKKWIDLCEKIIKFDQSVWSLPQSHTLTDI